MILTQLYLGLTKTPAIADSLFPDLRKGILFCCFCVMLLYYPTLTRNWYLILTSLSCNNVQSNETLRVEIVTLGTDTEVLTTFDKTKLLRIVLTVFARWTGIPSCFGLGSGHSKLPDLLHGTQLDCCCVTDANETSNVSNDSLKPYSNCDMHVLY